MSERLNNNKLENDEVEIDLLELFQALKRKIWMILAGGLVCALIAGVFTSFFMVPVYTSTSSMLVLSKETTLTSIADLQLGSQLTNDYRVLIKSTPVLEQVIENLNLDMTPEVLNNSISIENPSDTRILEITVENTDPVMAKQIVDEVAEVSSVFVGDKMEVIPPKIIEEGKIPADRTSPSVEKNTLMGLLIGMLICAAIIVAYAVMDDTIKSEEDITKYLGVTMLVAVPDRKDYINETKKKNKKRH